MKIPGATECSLCTKVFFFVIELAIFALTVTLLYWYGQSLQPVVRLLEPPVVTTVTRDYLEVKWHAQLVTDCPGHVYPAIVADYATEALPDYPFIVEPTPKKFTRRYPIPDYIQKLHDIYHPTPDQLPPPLEPPKPLELRIRMVATCNPLWNSYQWLRVPFDIPHR